MNKRISKLEADVRCYDERTLSTFEDTLEWLKYYKKALSKRGIDLFPVQILGRDPQLTFNEEKDRVARAKQAIEDIKAGKKVNPERSIDYWTRTIIQKTDDILAFQDEVENIREDIEKVHGLAAIFAAEEANELFDCEEDDEGYFDQFD